MSKELTQEIIHCRDCCCARSWKALGITEKTGKSIPEHIEELRQQLADEKAEREADEEHWEKAYKETHQSIVALLYENPTEIDKLAIVGLVKAIAEGNIQHLEIKY
ncbi:hypothetical protein KAR91_59950 [Candidatus Pacearchaeota archaeon]|nr:hypothetical protein [Candidatus Pacearchaeota archaeon]